MATRFRNLARAESSTTPITGIGSRAYFAVIRDDAMAAYGPKSGAWVTGFGRIQAGKVAEAATSGWYRDGVPKVALPGITAPKPGKLRELGEFLRLDIARGPWDPGIEKIEPDKALPLWWSDSMQALFILENLKEGPCVLPPTDDDHAFARMWARGKPARCRSKSKAVIPTLRYAVPALAIDYMSDKFETDDGGHPKVTHYCHHHDPGVVAYMDRPYDKSPTVIMLRGGRLRVTAAGIAG